MVGRERGTFFDEGFVEDWSEGRVQLFPHILQEHGTPELHRVLQSPQEVGLLQVYHFQILQNTIHPLIDLPTATMVD